MKRLINIFRRKKKTVAQNEYDLLRSIGFTYLQACKNDREFRRKMEKTDFGKSVKLALTKARNEASSN